MSKTTQKARTQTQTTTVADACRALETIAPAGLAQEWDNVGLLAGDPAAPIKRALLCIDLTVAVAEEAVKAKADLVLAYHPPIFRPVRAICADSRGPEAAVFRCIQSNAAVYALHTALDAADGGTNDVIAQLCGIKRTEPLQYADRPGGDEFKVVVFVPPAELDEVSRAMFDAGAGWIGDYSHCSYRISGTGTFFGGESTSPTVGQKGRLETVDEIRLETVVRARALPAVVSAMIHAHSYEEPAFDIYPLKSKPARGIGRIGDLPGPIGLKQLAAKLKRQTDAETVQIVGDSAQKVRRAVIVVGAAGQLPFGTSLTENDVMITGEIRHHDALTIQRSGASAIALGHWASERPVLGPLAKRFGELLPGVRFDISKRDTDPFRKA